VDYIPKTNAVILLDVVHKLRENVNRRDNERERNLEAECG
jgi:hypothetical protein